MREEIVLEKERGGERGDCVKEPEEEREGIVLEKERGGARGDCVREGERR